VSQYDGLNLPQLLNLMHGLEQPAPVPLLPQAPGWWIVAGWLLAVLVLAALQFARWRRRNRYRRAALAEINSLAARQDMQPAESAQRIATVLKRTALVAYPRAEIASLHGAAWAQFLVESAGNDSQVAAAADLLASAAYRPDANPDALRGPASRWIRLHRA
jgi:hypothetical protein